MKLLPVTACEPYVKVDVPGSQCDNARTAANRRKRAPHPANFNAAQFDKLDLPSCGSHKNPSGQTI